MYYMYFYIHSQYKNIQKIYFHQFIYMLFIKKYSFFYKHSGQYLFFMTV